MRPSEDGSEYLFVSRDDFEKAISEGRFEEWAEFNGNLYGTPVPNAPDEKDVLLEIEIQGAMQIAEKYPPAVIIQIQPPDVETLTERLRNRGDSDAHVAQRLSTTPWETTKGGEIAHYQVINDDLERATGEILSILEELRDTRNAAN
jgi:guanylate kinase